MAKASNTKEQSRARESAPDWSAAALSRDEFVEKIQRCGIELYRELPWRNIDDAYGVLVSEVMLQQTQVARVMNYWQRWMELFPTVDALAAADTALVLEMWQGLGYNRRALALKRACETCSEQYAGTLPRTFDELVALPGIGPATAAGILAFAYQQHSVYIETNVRSVFLHELFPHAEGVSDKQLVPYVADTCPAGVTVASWAGDGDPIADGRTAEVAGTGRTDDMAEDGRVDGVATGMSLLSWVNGVAAAGRADGMADGVAAAGRANAWGPREWYYALLDYGAQLKKQVANPSRRSAHHGRQSKFEGSHREKRSVVLRQVLAASDGINPAEVRAALDAYERDAGRVPVDDDAFASIVDELVAEGFFHWQDELLVP